MNDDTAADGSELDELRLQVISEQAAGLRWQIALTASIVLAIAWRDVPVAWTLAWFVAVIASREVRAGALQRMVAERAQPIAERLQRTAYWNLLLGLCNGSAALFMAWLDTTLDAVLTMILVSWGAGAVSTSSTVMRAFIAYATPVFVPIALMWLLQGSWLGLGIGALVLMFFGVQLRFARRNLETFEQSYRIRLENAELARKLEVERGELARARDAAEQANLEKSRFLAAASHDLRQPLQAITLNAGELVRQPLPPAARAAADDLATSAEHLRTMLDALLDISKLDAGVVIAQRRPVRLDTLLNAVVASFHAAASARGLALSLRCEPALVVDTDPDLLRRLLANLIDNAVKFTPSGAVDVRARESDGAVELTVHDTGPGIAAEHHGLIFEDLVQLRGAGERAPGHGLGLGIVRRVAALLDLRLTLRSDVGRGSVFGVRLPLAPGRDAAAQTAARSWSLAGRRVLVLDDDSMLRGAYANVLAGLGAQACTTAQVADAVAQLAGDRQDAAVVDFRLREEADGFDAVELLRRQQPGLPIVMVSADTGVALSERARGAGVPLLRKPVDAETLGRAIAGVIDGGPESRS